LEGSRFSYSGRVILQFLSSLTASYSRSGLAPRQGPWEKKGPNSQPSIRSGPTTCSLHQLLAPQATSRHRWSDSPAMCGRVATAPQPALTSQSLKSDENAKAPPSRASIIQSPLPPLLQLFASHSFTSPSSLNSFQVSFWEDLVYAFASSKLAIAVRSSSSLPQPLVWHTTFSAFTCTFLRQPHCITTTYAAIITSYHQHGKPY